MSRFFLSLIFVLGFSFIASAQFNSGSTGADGALDTDSMSCPDNVCSVQLPESGVLNYTTVNVRAGKTSKFRFNFRNTAAILLATGSVNIEGGIDVAAGPSTSPYVSEPGPGGFYGASNGGAGSGPGAGQNGCHAIWIGPLSLTPIIGGSGGNGGSGGGGALVIASSMTITLASGSVISANGAGWSVNTCWGSGGAVRLVANTLNIAGAVSAISPYAGGPGMIRFEAQPGPINYTGTTNPAAIFGPVNSIIIPVNPPTLAITSIASYAVPSYSTGRPDRIDLVLPTQLPDPIQVHIQGQGVPAGTEVQLLTTAGTPTGCTLATSPGDATCNGSVSGLSRSGITTLMAVATFTPSASLAPVNPKGPNQVSKIKIETAIGAKPKYSFLRKNGRVIDPRNLSAKFLKEFGM